jgi:hypothetical protein
MQVALPLPLVPWAAAPSPVQAPLLEHWVRLRVESPALRTPNAAEHERLRESEARLDQNCFNSSRPLGRREVRQSLEDR